MKTKEGGVMDIQKIKELALANGFKLKEQASGNLDLNAYVYDFANAVEREAKAQAVPEGFVLVNKKDLVKVLNCVTDDWLIDTDSFEEFKKIESLVQDEVNAMLEAQEPANGRARD